MSGSILIDRDLTEVVIGAAIEVHRTLGPGLLESVYEECMCHELLSRGIRFQRQPELPIVYKQNRLNYSFRIDLLVEDRLIVELKCVETLAPIHECQLLTYLRLAQIRVGLLINFNVPVLKDGIVRRVV
jgi:GxxExxY protein